MTETIAREKHGPRDLSVKIEREGTSILKDLLLLSSGKYISLMVSIIRGFVIPKLLDPALFGTWKSLLMITDYARIGHLGTISALTREVPFYIGKSDNESLLRTKNTGFTAAVLSGGVISVAVIVASFFVASSFIAACLRWFAVLVLFQQVNLFAETYLGGCKDFAFLARISVSRSLLMAGLSLGLAWLYGLPGLIWGTVAGTAAILFSYLHRFRFQVRFQFPRTTVVQLVKVGFPLLSTGILYQVLTGIDKLMVIKWLGMTEMGYYALGLTIIDFVFQLAWTFGQVLSPRLIARYSINEQLGDVKGYVMKPLVGLGIGMPVVLVGCYLGSEFLYEAYLPKYLPGLNSLRILIGGMYFGTLWVGLISFFLSLKKQIRIIPIYIAAIFINAGLNYSFIRAGFGINGVAIGTALANCFFGMALIGYAVSHFFTRSSEYLKLFARLLLSLAYSSFLLFILELGGNSLFKNPSGLAESIIKFLVFCALYSPILFWVSRTIDANLFNGILRAIHVKN